MFRFVGYKAEQLQLHTIITITIALMFSEVQLQLPSHKSLKQPLSRVLVEGSLNKM